MVKQVESDEEEDEDIFLEAIPSAIGLVRQITPNYGMSMSVGLLSQRKDPVGLTPACAWLNAVIS
jgi:hypothetical protein